MIPRARLDGAHGTVVDHDARGLGLRQHDCAERLGGARVADRHLPGIEVHVLPDPQRGLDVHGPAGDLEAARAHPVERLAGVVGNVRMRSAASRTRSIMSPLLRRELTMPAACGEVGEAISSLEHRRPAAAPGEREGGCRAQAARADHDDVGRPAHGSGTVLGWPIAARNSSLAPDVHVVASSTAANPTDS
jgi:hypothetical protein